MNIGKTGEKGESLVAGFMRKNGCKDPSEIFYMAMDSEQNVSIVRKKKKKKFA